MADVLPGLFINKKANPALLKEYGFILRDSVYCYEKFLPESGFRMAIFITPQGEVEAKVTDPAFAEPYTLHLVDGAVGDFVGGIKAEYENLLTDISVKCFAPDVFKTPYAKELIAYVGKTYGTAPEFLWQKFPDNAVWRRQDNRKWYGALLTVAGKKLGLDGDEKREIIDLRATPAEIESLIDGKKYFPGWHMNKKNWYTMLLDGSVPIEEICARLENSYVLAKK